MSFDKITVVGLGYIGLPTAAVFASRQIKVLGVDVNQQVVTTINGGDIHIVESGLEDVVRDAVSHGYLRAATRPGGRRFLIAVPTPFKEVSGDCGPEPDLTFVKAAVRSIAPLLKKEI